MVGLCYFGSIATRIIQTCSYLRKSEIKYYRARNQRRFPKLDCLPSLTPLDPPIAYRPDPIRFPNGRAWDLLRHPSILFLVREHPSADSSAACQWDSLHSEPTQNKTCRH